MGPLLTRNVSNRMRDWAPQTKINAYALTGFVCSSESCCGKRQRVVVKLCSAIVGSLVPTSIHVKENGAAISKNTAVEFSVVIFTTLCGRDGSRKIDFFFEIKLLPASDLRLHCEEIGEAG